MLDELGRGRIIVSVDPRTGRYWSVRTDALDRAVAGMRRGKLKVVGGHDA